jgi:hypothetical protein
MDEDVNKWRTSWFQSPVPVVLFQDLLSREEARIESTHMMIRLPSSVLYSVLLLLSKSHSCTRFIQPSRQRPMFERYHSVFHQGAFRQDICYLILECFGEGRLVRGREEDVRVAKVGVKHFFKVDQGRAEFIQI